MASSSYLVRAKIYPLDRVVGQARNQEFLKISFLDTLKTAF